MVCNGIYHLLIRPKKVYTQEKFKKIMEHKQTTIDILCWEIERLKRELIRNNSFLHIHNLYLEKMGIIEEFRKWKMEK